MSEADPKPTLHRRISTQFNPDDFVTEQARAPAAGRQRCCCNSCIKAGLCVLYVLAPVACVWHICAGA